MAGGIKFVKSKKTTVCPSPHDTRPQAADHEEEDRSSNDNADIDTKSDGKEEDNADMDMNNVNDEWGNVGQLYNRLQEQCSPEDVNSGASHAGLGFGGSGGISFPSLAQHRSGVGLGFNAEDQSGLVSSNGRRGLGSSTLLPTSLGRKIQTIPASSSSAPSSSSAALAPESTFSSAKPEKVDKDFAKFEKMNKGIGLKYMLKMGYKVGEGLGKGGSGIVEPIDVKLRPQKMGLGHKGFDETTKAQKKLREKVKSQYVLSDDEDRDKEGGKLEGNDGRKGKNEPVADGWKTNKKGKKKISYRTANDVVKELEEQAAAFTDGGVQKVKIIDMTGREAREVRVKVENHYCY
jgi:hypothetical protein